jgi:polyisoprenoid-binding protein YceI
MRKRLLAPVVLLVAIAVPAAADDYTIDGMHTSVSFKIAHIGLSWTHGRFNDVSGSFSIDPADASKCTFSLSIKANSIDTNNAKRDDHLRSPDFLNVKQYPTLTFKSTSVKPIKDGYLVTGELNLHGTTKSVSFSLIGGRKAEFPKGVQRTGYTTDLAIKRSDFGMDKMAPAIGEEVFISISFEGTKK